ncbi:hypothetical protein QLH52_03490 [Methylomonas sp. OY6]|uniref:Uncharacterized protein n=1 Tax=Methylomonas defluvii TaxID=3045149 RepID=A0ABU4UA78_9GAMM|nr:hypothetical protein [Methylomonas sp. OY6]MDX8126331.1 hypothetical protein [Methylomonas sp. OY6]
MTNLDKSTKSDSSNINTKWFVVFICSIVSVVIGGYFFNFNDQLSDRNEVWGTFGDYVGGILNPVIAAFAFYLISKTYELQKRELEATRSLLEVSTDAQKQQIKLAALTVLLNSNLMRIDMLRSERLLFLERKISVLPRTLLDHKQSSNQEDNRKDGVELLKNSRRPQARLENIENEIKSLTDKNIELEGQIERFLKEKIQ